RGRRLEPEVGERRPEESRGNDPDATGVEADAGESDETRERGGAHQSKRAELEGVEAEDATGERELMLLPLEVAPEPALPSGDGERTEGAEPTAELQQERLDVNEEAALLDDPAAHLASQTRGGPFEGRQAKEGEGDAGEPHAAAQGGAPTQNEI